MWTRRRFLSRGGLGALMAGSAFGFSGDGPDKPPEALPDGSASRGMINEATEDAIKRGLQYLAAQHRDGRFGTRAYQGNVAVCALGGLAFLSAGSQPDRGKYGRIITQTLAFLLEQARGAPNP